MGKQVTCGPDFNPEGGSDSSSTTTDSEHMSTMSSKLYAEEAQSPEPSAPLSVKFTDNEEGLAAQSPKKKCGCPPGSGLKKPPPNATATMENLPTTAKNPPAVVTRPETAALPVSQVPSPPASML